MLSGRLVLLIVTGRPHPALQLALLLLLALGASDGFGQPREPEEQEEKTENQTPGCDAQDSSQKEPETRAGRLRRKRCEKAQLPPEPHKAGFVERSLLTFQKAERPSILYANVWDIYPRIQGIARGSKNAIGLRLWKPNIARSLDIHASAFYSINKYQFYDFQIGRIPHEDVKLGAIATLPLRSTKGDDVFEVATLEIPDGRGWMAYFSARYEHYPRLKYYGLGPDTTPETETNFLGRGPTFELRTGYQVSRNFLILANFGLQDTEIGSGEDPDDASIEDIFDDETAPGLDDAPNMWRFNSTRATVPATRPAERCSSSSTRTSRTGAVAGSSSIGTPRTSAASSLWDPRNGFSLCGATSSSTSRSATLGCRSTCLPSSEEVTRCGASTISASGARILSCFLQNIDGNPCRRSSSHCSSTRGS